MAQELKDTLQLPKTDFPMRANLVQREPARLAHWETLGLYERIQDKNSGTGKVFVLHDGPPFTNGDVHIGTALNKVLKDITLRYKSMRGFRTPYVPGWDCHGLPIEQKAARALIEAGKQGEGFTTVELREYCDNFAEEWIAKQTAQFKRLGVLADWKNEYKTKAPAFEADILRTFATFVEKGLVYRAKRPVYWSIPFQTALAEAEIEYKEHTSPSIWVKFPVPADEATKFGLPTDKPLSIVIWTTTPWTLPANLAIAVNPDEEYSTVRIGPAGDQYYLLFSKKLASKVLSDTKLAGPVSNPGNLPPNVILDGRSSPVISKEIQDTFYFSWIDIRLGKSLEKLASRHPFIDRASPVVLADYVTTESGTGCVHTAPGHGMDDYQTGLKYGLEIYCPVGADGKYIDDGRMPADLVGLTTLETVEDLEKKRTSPANISVLKKLTATGTLLAKEKYVHSYPHCWRSKTPIIFRAVDQWFVGLDRVPPELKGIAYSADGKNQSLVGTHNTVRRRALDEIALIAVNKGWIPAWGEARIRGAVESRPDWCVSRQRTWGVPIPAFYDADKKPYLDGGVARAIADKIERLGTNFWYDATPEIILENVNLPAGWPAPSALTCGRDTLDVWLDSGSSHAAVLKRQQGGTQWPADLYLEGSDQHRGWFQSSLWTSVIAFGRAPYKAVLTHGFIVDEDRKKISKSSSYEKPQTSDAYIAKLGADVVRLWIASQDFRDDIPISDEILGHVGETYRLFRNTFRYQISVLNDFDPARDAVPVGQMDTLDRWALHQTAALLRDCTAAYDAYEFHRVYQLCNQFCSVTLSATYHDILKDRLYTLAANSPLRRSSQTAIHHIFQTLAKLLAPIVIFTADEAWSFATAKKELAADSIHLQDWPVAPAAWSDTGIETDFAVLLRVRAQVNEALEPARQAGLIGKSLDAAIGLTVAATDAAFPVLEKHREFLPELFIVSHVTIAAAAGPPPGISVRPAQELGYVRCPRCWRWVPALENNVHGDVCPRCVQALSLI